ncbi:MAG: ATP-binding cassette domain-containing protein [Nitrososphaerota archaeon]
MYAIETNSLTKEFGKIRAVDNISFKVDTGEIFGFLGPNGAGKSTTMMILTTLLRPTSGSASVAGFDVVTQATKVRQNIGYVQQEISVDEFLSGRENLLIQARLNHVQKDQTEKRIDDVLGLVELTDKQKDPALTYSGGMRKRLDIAGGLLNRPKVLFLDEPTVGLDIQTRRKIWAYIKKIHEEFEMSIFLSTHYMEEADQLCDRIAIIDYGKIQANDTPKSMKAALGNYSVTFTINDLSKKNNFLEKIKELEHVKDITTKDEKIAVFSSKESIMSSIFNLSSGLGIEINSITFTQPTLDDVFIAYTGHDLRDNGVTYDRRKEHIKMKRIRA